MKAWCTHPRGTAAVLRRRDPFATVAERNALWHPQPPFEAGRGGYRSRGPRGCGDGKGRKKIFDFYQPQNTPLRSASPPCALPCRISPCLRVAP